MAPSPAAWKVTPRCLPQLAGAARGRSWSAEQPELGRVGGLSRSDETDSERPAEEDADPCSSDGPDRVPGTGASSVSKAGEAGPGGRGLYPSTSAGGLVGACVFRRQQRARGPCLKLLPELLEFKLTPLSQRGSGCKSLLERWVLSSPQENNDLGRCPENGCSFHKCLLSFPPARLGRARPQARPVCPGDGPGEGTPTKR